MRATLEFVQSKFDSPSRQLQGLSDLEILVTGTRIYILAAGAADGGVSSYEILNNGDVVSADDILLTAGSGTLGVSDLTSFSAGGDTFVLASGQFDNNQVVYQIGNNGSFSVSDNYTAPSTYSGWNLTTVADSGGNMYLFGGIWGGTGFFEFDVDTDADLSAPELHPDDTGMFLGDVTAIHSATLHGKSFLFVASGVDAGLHSYELMPDGSLNLLFTAPPSLGGFAGVTSLETVDVGGERSFVIVASAGTDSILVFRVSQGGKLQHADTFTDTNDTRIAGVSALEVFEVGGQYFLLAGGSDDGITLFEIDYRGRLKVLTTVVDDVNLALQNVTDIEAEIVGGELYVFVSSATDHGFTQFVLDLPGGTGIIRGGPGEDSLTGTAGDDTIFGHGRADELFGLGGSDRLVDGLGPDVLWGGNGADIFEFVPDNRTDWIKDFKVGVDRIDLSGYALLYHSSAITFEPTLHGVTLTIKGDKLRIESFDGEQLTQAMFTEDDFIFG